MKVINTPVGADRVRDPVFKKSRTRSAPTGCFLIGVFNV